MTTWRCVRCDVEVELPTGKLPPVDEMHPVKGSELEGGLMDLSKICAAGEYLKVSR